MAPQLNFKNGLSSLFFWSVISAAFIGPGTVTTAASSGSGFGTGLIWALVFSTIACLILQECAGRIRLGTGKNLGEAIALRFKSGRTSKLVRQLIIFAVVFGCASYQAGNIMGAVSGISVIFDVNPKWVTVLVVVLASWGLWAGSIKVMIRIMSSLVALMGFSFIYAAIKVVGSANDLSFIPIPSFFPEGSQTYIMGLIGTTIVPYNLFLASGLKHNQSLKEMRIGMTGAILLGGIISISILLTGTLVSGTFDFGTLAAALNGIFGAYGGILLGLGLFCAGFTSSITAPMAAAITWQSVSGQSMNMKAKGYRMVWALVMATGFVFGVSGLKPIPVILIAQAINGLLLPVSAIFLIIIINDRSVPTAFRNSGLQNFGLITVVALAIALGVNNLSKFVSGLLNMIS